MFNSSLWCRKVGIRGIVSAFNIIHDRNIIIVQDMVVLKNLVDAVYPQFYRLPYHEIYLQFYCHGVEVVSASYLNVKSAYTVTKSVAIKCLGILAVHGFSFQSNPKTYFPNKDCIRTILNYIR